MDSSRQQDCSQTQTQTPAAAPKCPVMAWTLDRPTPPAQATHHGLRYNAVGDVAPVHFGAHSGQSSDLDLGRGLLLQNSGRATRRLERVPAAPPTPSTCLLVPHIRLPGGWKEREPQGCIGRGAGTPSPHLQAAQPMPSQCPPSCQAPASMAFVTDSNRPQPLWQPPPTACRTASGAASEVPSLQMHPWGAPRPEEAWAMARVHKGRSVQCTGGKGARQWPRRPEVPFGYKERDMVGTLERTQTSKHPPR